MTESTSWESPQEDVAEQRAEVGPRDDQVTPSNRTRWDVDPADAAEQDIEVPIDEDEWR
jgi:hypothetical protein